MIQRDRAAELRAGAWVCGLLALTTAWATWSSLVSLDAHRGIEDTARLHPVVVGLEALVGAAGVGICGGMFVALFLALALAGAWGARRRG